MLPKATYTWHLDRQYEGLLKRSSSLGAKRSPTISVEFNTIPTSSFLTKQARQTQPRPSANLAKTYFKHVKISCTIRVCSTGTWYMVQQSLMNSILRPLLAKYSQVGKPLPKHAKHMQWGTTKCSCMMTKIKVLLLQVSTCELLETPLDWDCLAHGMETWVGRAWKTRVGLTV